MFGHHHHYVPILKWKRGEQNALKATSAASKARLTPLIELVSVPVDLKTKLPKKSLVKHIDDAVGCIGACWGTRSLLFLDPGAASGSGGAMHTFAMAKTQGIQFVPVTGPGRAKPEIAAALSHTTNGLCLRLQSIDLARPKLSSEIASILADGSIDPSSVDAIVDLGSLHGNGAQAAYLAATSALSKLPSLKLWRTLTLAASGFPPHMGGVATHGVATVDRVEWDAWVLLHGSRASLQRLPTFGDYGIQHPSGSDTFDPRFMKPAASIRYTLPRQWFLVKGESTKKTSSKVQYPKLAHKLVNSGHYLGHGHCSGSGDMHACSRGRPGFGSLEAWRRLGTVHHLEVTTGQLAAVAYP